MSHDFLKFWRKLSSFRNNFHTFEKHFLSALLPCSLEFIALCCSPSFVGNQKKPWTSLYISKISEISCDGVGVTIDNSERVEPLKDTGPKLVKPKAHWLLSEVFLCNFTHFNTFGLILFWCITATISKEISTFQKLNS